MAKDGLIIIRLLSLVKISLHIPGGEDFYTVLSLGAVWYTFVLKGYTSHWNFIYIYFLNSEGNYYMTFNFSSYCLPDHQINILIDTEIKSDNKQKVTKRKHVLRENDTLRSNKPMQ